MHTLMTKQTHRSECALEAYHKSDHSMPMKLVVNIVHANVKEKETR